MNDQRNIAINIEDEMRSAFLDYSMSVIVSRALPDVRDGLKPVHRRILYAMYLLKNFASRPYLKSARIVGEVIGRFHPHGDSAVYEALVRLAQSFSMRYPIIDGQGNFGSIDGDSAAAMRYTEVRMQRITDLVLADIDKETVDFGPNYDNKEDEPLVLPTKVPNLLINGASGIAVGMATNIPPHNLTEICNGLLALIEKPSISIDELMQYIKGPDFPTAGAIYGMAGIYQAFHKGRGSIVMRAKAEVESGPGGGRDQIVVSELPYQTNKAKLIEKIADLVREKKIEGISDIRDESAQEDIRVVIELKKGESGEVILNNLYNQTQMQSSFGVNMVALVDGQPRLLNLKQMLEQFYYHRREVILRRTAFQLRRAEERAHILIGLKTAVENADDVVELIRKAKDTTEAQEQLMSRFELSELQAKAILDMRLARLTGLEREKIVKEHQEVVEFIADQRDILDTPKRVTDIVVSDINEIRDTYGDARRTLIIETESDGFSMESLVADEDVAVTITQGGYIKRTPLDAISAQKRGGKGRKGMQTKSEDMVKDIFTTSNHSSLLCFTNQGRVYQMKVYESPEAELSGRGKHFANLLKLNPDENVVSVLPIKEFKESQFIVSATKNGYIKKTSMMAYANVRNSGIIGLILEDGDELISCAVTSGGDDILMATRLGKAIRFSEEDCRPMGRSSRGVTGIKFEEKDEVIGLAVLNNEQPILSVCENGYGKRTPIEEYRKQSRAGKGIYTIKVTERNGPVVGILQVAQDDQLMLMTSSGKVTRFSVNEVGLIGRNTQGVRLMKVDDGETVISFARIQELGGDGDDQGDDQGDDES